VRFSADGRWLAFSRAAAGDPGGPAVVAVHGGAVTRPLGGGILAWSWAPTGALLYGVNTRGQLLSAAPGGRSRIISTGSAMSNAWAPAVAPSPSGRLIAVDRSRCSGTPETELDTTDPLSGIGQAALTHAVGQVTFAGWSPDGRWLLYWAAAMCSSSLAADGWPLRAVPVSGGRSVPAVAHMLLFPDFLTWCGHQLIAASGPTRETQLASSLVATAPPSWRQRTIARASRLSWVSPSCAPSGDVLAAAAGANSENPGFGFAHRSIWLLAPDGRILRRIASPSSLQLSDEAPRFSRDGRWILFVESRVVPVGDSAISRDTIELVPAAAGGDAPAIPIVHFSSDDFSYYDHFSWPSEIDWH
jgi:Tol biopolymer transport system component